MRCLTVSTATPGVESVSRLLAYEIQTTMGLPASLAGASRGRNAPRQNLTLFREDPVPEQLFLESWPRANNAVGQRALCQ